MDQNVPGIHTPTPTRDDLGRLESEGGQPLPSPGTETPAGGVRAVSPQATPAAHPRFVSGEYAATIPLTREEEDAAWHMSPARWQAVRRYVRVRWPEISDQDLDGNGGYRQALSAGLRKYYGLGPDEMDRALSQVLRNAATG
jgi:hypothetical protein